jgi:hypothetical protein
MYHDGVVGPHPPVSRCLLDTVQTLEKAGYTTVPWDPTLHQHLVNCINQLLSLDCQEEFNEVLKAGREPPTPLSKLILDNTDTTPLTIKDTGEFSHVTLQLDRND